MHRVHLRETDCRPLLFDYCLGIIKYDRSGRSEGIAIISYETPAEAKKALGHYNGKLCKGALCFFALQVQRSGGRF